MAASGTPSTYACPSPAWGCCCGRAFWTWLLICAVSLGLAFGLRALAVGQFYRADLDSGAVSTLAMRATPTADIEARTLEILGLEALVTYREQNPGAGLFIQSGTGRGFLKHVLIDLGMREDAVDGLPLLDKSEFAVVSRVTDRSGRDLPGSKAYGFANFIEPLFLVQRAPGAGLDLTPLPPGDFHPEFSRIRF